ncbi:hypothetical protein EDD85DRAFT_9604 [Armillaria nabsnona]|nr:hypothetical protein EDD85DRAFT_9604 [Armillaria nabsnona]
MGFKLLVVLTLADRVPSKLSSVTTTKWPPSIPSRNRAAVIFLWSDSMSDSWAFYSKRSASTEGKLKVQSQLPVPKAFSKHFLLPSRRAFLTSCGLVSSRSRETSVGPLKIISL